ncbi:MAG: peptidase domain-containing ABC transporter [Allosphingosinicella sp.]
MSAQLDLGLFRRRRVRLVRQTEVSECGLAAVTMVANYHGLEADLATVRRRFQPSLRGAALKTLISVADALGFNSRAVKVPLEQIGNLELPAVLHWNLNHYVVLEAVRRGRALIHDPAGGSRWLPLARVSDHFTGIALELRPAGDFEPLRESRRLRLSHLWSRISGLKRALVQTLVLSLVMQAFVLASPYYMQVALDSALPALDRNLLTVLALGFALFTLIHVTAELLRAFVLLAAGTSLGFGVAANIARRLFHLPIGWFEKRHVGDILSRFQSITPIRMFLTEGAVATLLDGTLALFTLALMLLYSRVLAAVALCAFLLYLLVRLVSFKAQRDAQEDAIVLAGREQSTMIESIRGIVTLRLFNREASRHALWQSRLTDSMNALVSLGRVTAWQKAANTLIFGAELVISTWLAVRLLMAGGFSVGMVFAFIAYKTQFLQRSASLIDQLIAFRMLRLHLERLSDIALAPKDASFSDLPGAGGNLTGRIELRGISFRYGPGDPYILRDAHLVVRAGEHVAITGPSGGGKTTLVKIMLGLLEPEAGEVLVDGVPLARFGYKYYHDQVAAVLQDDHLFAGSLAENIALFDDRPEMPRIVASATAAALHDDIAAMPMGYETLVGDMGSSLSGGQRQRLLLARALYRRPRLLVMDEATSHLDASREKAVVGAIAGLGITRIVIAHRRETILSADRVYSTRDGGLVEVTDQFRAPPRATLAGDPAV